MLKILLLSHHFDPDVGGIETNSKLLASAFHDSGAEVHLVTWTKQQSLKLFPFTVIRNPNIKKLWNEHQWADVVFENNPCLRLSWPNIFISKPLVIALNTWVTRLSGKKGFRDKLKHAWFKRANKIIAVSDAVRKKEWPEAVVIENPYDSGLFKINPDISRTINFAFLGRLVSDKGADQAVRALSILIQEKLLDKNVSQLTIIGDGAEKENLISLTKELRLTNAVHFTGILKGKELVECLNRHKYLLVPSSWEEPYGNVVLEGMACGCIPISSDGGGLPEAVGNAGIIFKRNDLDSMAAALKMILSNAKKAECFNKKAAIHLSQHSIDLVSQKYFTILKQAVLGDKP